MSSSSWPTTLTSTGPGFGPCVSDLGLGPSGTRLVGFDDASLRAERHARARRSATAEQNVPASGSVDALRANAAARVAARETLGRDRAGVELLTGDRVAGRGLVAAARHRE